MLRVVVRRLVGRCIIPNSMRLIVAKRRLRRDAMTLRRLLRAEASVAERVQMACQHRSLRSNQKPSEIERLLKEIQNLTPATICEIGAAGGGTFALFASVAAPRARLLSIDICYPQSRSRIYQLLAQPATRVTCLEGDSHEIETLERVKRWLGHASFDFLFIDGDHTYEGVKQDYEMYAPLVRDGGIIALHDIVPDFRTRHGIETRSNVGEVPRFWRELRLGLDNTLTKELIEDPEQDGFGIGVIRQRPCGLRSSGRGRRDRD